MNEPINLKRLGEVLDVTPRQLHAWATRRRTSGFPEPVAQVLAPQYPGDKRRAPLYDLTAVLEWRRTYRGNRGAHWALKRQLAVA